MHHSLFQHFEIHILQAEPTDFLFFEKFKFELTKHILKIIKTNHGKV